MCCCSAGTRHNEIRRRWSGLLSVPTAACTLRTKNIFSTLMQFEQVRHFSRPNPDRNEPIGLRQPNGTVCSIYAVVGQAA